MTYPMSADMLATEESIADINARIEHTFSVLNKVSQGIINGHIRSVIVSGAAGCGKTYTLETALVAAERADLVRYQSVKGAMSAIGLYRQLFECSEPGNVLVLDDCDSIFSDLDALNLLKAALDTGKNRKVHWNKESRILDGEGVPRTFEFGGAIAFITNIDFSAEILAEKKMTPHYKALMSRCLYVDLGIHNNREILTRIGQVVFSEEFLKDNDLRADQAANMMRWITGNLLRVRTLSIRTILQLASLVKSDRDWEGMANTVMLRSR